MKITRLLVVGLLSLTIRAANAQQWRIDRYDSRWLPITDKEMEREVRVFSNNRDTVSLYRLYDRARYQRKEPSYFSTLKQIKRDNPQNGVVLATYCAVLMDANQLYGFGQYRFKADKGEGSVDNIQRNLAVAKKLEPRLWLILLTEADIAECSNGDRKEGTQNAVNLCREAVRLAPSISFAHERLGYWLVNLAGLRKQSYAEAVESYKKAQTLRPINCDASFLLMNVYRYYEPNPAQARKTAQVVLTTIPPNVKLDAKMRQFLLKQGVTPPR